MAKKEFFKVIDISRDDIRAYVPEVDADALTDEQMEEICEQTKVGLLNNDFWYIVQLSCEHIGNLPKKPEGGDDEDEDLSLDERTYDTLEHGVCTISEGWEDDYVGCGTHPVWNVYNEDKELIGSIPHYDNVEDIADAIEQL